ncbi:MAG: hypothetical protein R2756_07670 [Bacteroidales bacterium]
MMLVERSRSLGEKLMTSLENMIKPDFNIEGDQRQEINDSNRIHPGCRAGTQEELVRRGFIVAKRSAHEVLRIDPALTIKEKDIDQFLFSLDEIITNLTTG